MEGLAGVKLRRSAANRSGDSTLRDRGEVAVKAPLMPLGFLKLRKDLVNDVVSDDHLIRVCPMKGSRRLGKLFKRIPPIGIKPQDIDGVLPGSDGVHSAAAINSSSIVNIPEEYNNISNGQAEIDNISLESASILSLTSKEILAKPNLQQTLLKYRLGTAPHDKTRLIEMKIGSQYARSLESREQINNEKLNVDNAPAISVNTTLIDDSETEKFSIPFGDFGPGNLIPTKSNDNASIFPSTVTLTGQVNLVVMPSKISASNSLTSDDNFGERIPQPSIEIEIVERKKGSVASTQPNIMQDFDDEVSHDSEEAEQPINKTKGKREVSDRGVKYTVKAPGTVNLDLYRLRIPSPKSSQRKSFLDADYSEPIYTPSSFRRPKSKGSRSVSPSFRANNGPDDAFDDARFDLDKYFDETMKDVISAVENSIPPNNRHRGNNTRGLESRGELESRGRLESRGGMSRGNEQDDHESLSHGTYESGSRGSKTVEIVDFMASLSIEIPPPEYLESAYPYPSSNAQPPVLNESSDELSGIEYYLSLLPNNMSEEEELNVMIGENKGGHTVQFNQIEKIIRPVHVDYPVDPVFLDGKGNVRLLDEWKYSRQQETIFLKNSPTSNMGQMLRTKLREEAKTVVGSQVNVHLQPRVVYYEAPNMKEVLTPAQRTLKSLERLNEIEAREKKAKELEEREKQEKLEGVMRAKGLKIKKRKKKKKVDVRNDLLNRPIAYSVNTSGKPNAALLAVSTSYIPSLLAYEPLTGITKSCELLVDPSSRSKEAKSANIVICKNIPVYQISEEEKLKRKRREDDELQNKAKLNREKRKSVISKPVR